MAKRKAGVGQEGGLGEEGVERLQHSSGPDIPSAVLPRGLQYPERVTQLLRASSAVRRRQAGRSELQAQDAHHIVRGVRVLQLTFSAVINGVVGVGGYHQRRPGRLEAYLPHYS